MKSPHSYKTALSVQQGIEQPEQINPYLKGTKKKRKKILPPEEFIEGILSGNRIILSQAITLIESTHPDHIEKAQTIIEKALPYAGKSVRIGITGVPGAGKSTFIESFGKYVTNMGHKLAVLAIDPSSERSKGSILGDKTRMEELSIDPNAFIRPSPSGLTLGGVAQKTRETITLCEAAGFDIIIVETVGVGQSETVVKSMVDFFLLVMLAGAGDELQGIKRGIMEMADAIIINKADGDNIEKANWAKAQYQSALRLFPRLESNWNVPVMTCSALEHKGIDEVWNTIEKYKRFTQGNEFFFNNRKEQLLKTFTEWVEFTLLNRFYTTPDIKKEMDKLAHKIKNGELTPYKAGEILLKEEF